MDPFRVKFEPGVFREQYYGEQRRRSSFRIFFLGGGGGAKVRKMPQFFRRALRAKSQYQTLRAKRAAKMKNCVCLVVFLC